MQIDYNELSVSQTSDAYISQNRGSEGGKSAFENWLSEAKGAKISLLVAVPVIVILLIALLFKGKGGDKSSKIEKERIKLERDKIALEREKLKQERFMFEHPELNGKNKNVAPQVSVNIQTPAVRSAPQISEPAPVEADVAATVPEAVKIETTPFDVEADARQKTKEAEEAAKSRKQAIIFLIVFVSVIVLFTAVALAVSQ